MDSGRRCSNATAVVSDVVSIAFAALAKRAANASSDGRRDACLASPTLALNASHMTIASSHPMPMSTNGTSTARKETNGESAVTRTKKNADGKASATPSTALVAVHHDRTYAKTHTNTSANAPAANFRSPNTSAAASSSLTPPPAWSTRTPTRAPSASQ